MSDEAIRRRLAAIFAADMVGYSRLMGADEEGTIGRQRAHRQELIDPSIAAHEGRIVKTTGDGMLVEFASVVDALRCAVEVQRAMADREAEAPKDRRIRYRIGINLGDIVIDGEDILGDGVNVAARLEGLAEPGGICLSDVVYKSVRGKLDLEFEDLGEKEVKNIAEPVRVYRVRLGEGAGDSPTSTAARPAPLNASAKPSIAVLPFNNMSGDSEQDFFADGLAEDIITTLSKVSGLLVIARNSTFAYKGRSVDVREVAGDLGVRYVLEGSVRKGGNRLRITAQLIDAQSGNHVWAERYDRVIEDIFDIQDEMTKEIVTALRVELTEGENARLMSKGTRSIEAWGLCGQALRLFDRWSSAENQQARALAEKALEIDTDYAFAWALVGITYWYEARITAREDAEALLTRCRDCVEKSLALDPQDPTAIGGNAVSLLSLGRFEEAVKVAQDGVALNPGSAESRAFLGFARTHAGHPEEAVAAFAEAMRMNPHHPLWYLPVLARAHDAAGQVDQATSCLESALLREAENFPAFLHLASLAGRRGDLADARTWIANVQRAVPNFTVGRAKQWLITREGPLLEAYVDGLRKAGLPE